MESDIFNQKPSQQYIKKVHYFYDSDIFNLKENKNKPTRNIKTGRCFIESGPEKDKKPPKNFLGTEYRETTQKDWIVARMRPQIRKPCEDNTLVYDLSKERPKIERTQKRKIVTPGKNVKEKRGKKILPDKIKEHPRNTLAYH